jgi:hypothetical protein
MQDDALAADAAGFIAETADDGGRRTHRKVALKF